MSTARRVAEIDVLIATAKRLVDEKWNLRALSPHIIGMAGEEREAAIGRLEGAGLNRAGEKIELRDRGPDIVAERDGCHWHIECKGAGSGDDGSVRETFLRGLADIVRYFDPPDGVEYRMGLALPDHPIYLAQLAPLPTAARRALHLWVILVAESGVKWFGPEESIERARSRRRSVMDYLGR